MKKYIFLTALTFVIVLSVKAGDWLNIVTPERMNEVCLNDGKAYIATWGGLFIYDFSTEEMQQITKTDGFLSNSIEDVLVDEYDNIWIGTYDNGVAMFDGVSWINYPIPDDLFASQTLLYAIEKDGDAVYAAFDKGLAKLHQGHWSLLSNQAAWDITKGSNGKLYVAGTYPQLLENDMLTEFTDCPRFSYQNSQILQNNNFLYFATHGTVSVLMDNSWEEIIVDGNQGFTDDIIDMEVDANGVLWVIVKDKGIYTLAGNSFTQVYAPSHVDIGTTTQLNFYDGKNIFFQPNKMIIKEQSYNSINMQVNNLSNNRIYDLFVDGNDVYLNNMNELLKFENLNFTSEIVNPIGNSLDYDNWFRSKSKSDGEQAFFNENTGELFYHGNITNLYDTNVLDLSYAVTQVLMDSREALWVTTYDGLYEFKDGTYTYFSSDNIGFESNIFWVVEEDRNGNIWTATSKDIGMWDGSSWGNYQNASANNYIFGGVGTELYFDEMNTLYYTCWANGLLKLENGIWTNYNSDNSDLPHNRIQDIMVQDGVMYLSTYWGLSRFDGQDFENISHKNSGLAHPYCSKSVFDEAGNLWISSQYGISVYNKDGIVSGISAINSFDLNIYPNPGHDVVHIECEEMLRKIELLDINGRVINEFQPNNKVWILDGSQLNTGLYFIHAETSDGMRFEKLVIK